MMLIKELMRPVSPIVSSIKRFRSTIKNVADTMSVLADDVGNKGVFTLNRPHALNAENYEMVEKIHTYLSKWQNSKSMILIKSCGGIGFCVGGDLKAIIDATEPDLFKKQMSKSYEINHMIRNLNIPYIAFIDGITIGSGAGISIPGKFRIATERTVFSMPEVTIGLVPDSSGSYFLPRLQGKLGYYLGLTGFQLKGADVLHAGLATHYCESTEIPKIEKTLLSLENTNEVESVINGLCPKPKSEFTLAKHLDQIHKSFDASSIEDILRNLKNDGSKWAKQTIDILRSMSPTSLKITLRQFNLGANFSSGQCLQMEYRLILNCFMESDCQEGIRAFIIDQDNNPKWNPSRIEDVTEDKVEYFFRPLANNEDLPINVKLPSKF